MHDERQQLAGELRDRLMSRGAGNPDDTADMLDAALAEIHHLRIALARRTVISEAVGITMERYQLSADEAFGVLCRLSQESNTKLHDLAAELVSESPSGRGVEPGSCESGSGLLPTRTC